MSNQEHQCAENQTGEDPEIAGFLENLSRDFDVLPLFERAYNEFIYKRKYSLNNNEKLRSRWHERVMKGKGAGSQELPNINDYHFHNCRNKFMPSQSLANYPSPRLQLAPGPGPDEY